MTIKLHNTNKMQTEVFSFDGDSVQLLPGAIRDVDDKFDWNLPLGVLKHKETRTVFNKKGAKEINNANKSKNAISVEDNRETITSGNVPEKPAVTKKVR